MFGKIIGTGKYVPSKKITNSMLAEVVETDDEWIKDRTGIESRHVMEYETTAYMAIEAAKKAIEVVESASFKDDLGADSLDLFELVMSLEDEFGVSIPTEDLEKINTVGDVIEYIKAHQ